MSSVSGLYMLLKYRKEKEIKASASKIDCFLTVWFLTMLCEHHFLTDKHLQYN